MPRSPADPAAPMKNYAQQTIFKMDQSAETADNARLLNAKRQAAGDEGRSTVEDWSSKGTHKDLSAVPFETRLYLVGHGSEDSRTVGGWTWDELGSALNRSLGSNRVKRVSLYACYSGGNLFGEREDRSANVVAHGRGSPQAVAPAESFASKLMGIVGGKVESISARTVRVHRVEFSERGVDTKDAVDAYNGLFDQLDAQKAVTVILPDDLREVLRRIPGLTVPPSGRVERTVVNRQWIPMLENLNRQQATQLAQMRLKGTRSFARIVPQTYDTIARPRAPEPGWHEIGSKVTVTLNAEGQPVARFHPYDVGA